MKVRLYPFVIVLLVALAAVMAYPDGASSGAEVSASEASDAEFSVTEVAAADEITGIWKFPVDGYYMGFDGGGNLCYGGSEESVAAKRYCNAYTVEDGVVTETCMGGPEDRNCPLGGGTCKARVSVSAAGELDYRILRGQCDMLAYKVVPPRQYTFSRDQD